MRLRTAAAGVVAALTLSGCGGPLPDNLRGKGSHGESHTTSPATPTAPAEPEAPAIPLRRGEFFRELTLEAEYTPKAPSAPARTTTAASSWTRSSRRT